jgi:stage V sporulation protein AF
VETLIFNTALLRRRIRDPHLTMEITSVGTRSKTDVVLCYMDDRVDEHLLKQMRKRLQNIQVDALALSQESLAECLLKPQWWNPFPKVRYTERPDAATASVYEGNILILIDNSPSVMLLPSSVFDYIQDTNDFYFPPIVGTYLRWVRVLIFVLTIFLTPVWYLLIRNPDWIPEWMSFIKISEPNGVPVIFQLLMIEFVIDGLKLASLNTPSALSNSFSVVGALILGDFAVRANWFVPDVVLYMAFVAIANFAQPSVELGYAFKLFRMLILILTAIGNGWGFLLGIVLMVVTIACTQTITGKNYLFPLIPFRGQALASLLIRKPIQHGSQKK